MWTLGRTEKEEMMGFAMGSKRIRESRGISALQFESSFRLLNIYSQKYLCEKISNLLSDICIGLSVSPERAGDHVNTPPSPSLEGLSLAE